MSYNKETQAIEKTPLILSLFASIIILLLHVLFLFYPSDHPIYTQIMQVIIGTGLFSSFFKPQLLALVFGLFYALGVKSIYKESIKIRPAVFLLIAGLGLYFGSYICLKIPVYVPINLLKIGYVLALGIGYVLLMTGLIRLKRVVQNNLMKDQFNQANKRFLQEKRKIENDYSVNIQSQDGWVNIINPFRATMVLGTPGSGKSYTIVEEFIRQHIQKGFSMLVYDFKYPDLSQVAYNYFLTYRSNYKTPAQIFIVNFNDPKNSHKINPIAPTLLKNPSDALAASEALFLNLNREYIKRKDFFTSSAVNLIAAIIWFLRTYKDGKYCTIPHAITLLNQPDEVLFQVLQTESSVQPLLSPFRDALSKKAFDQLAGQTASARIPISRMATKPLFWILNTTLNGSHIPLDINNPDKPILLFLANNPQSQSSYSAVYGLIASSITRVINQANRHPLSLIIDELPTIFINGLDNLIATARSNKISTLLSFQDLSQLERDYGKEVANAIFNTVGNKISGSVVADTAKKLSDMIGKTVQKRGSITYSSRGTSMGTTTTLDYLIPPETISQLSQGTFCGVLADTYEQPLAQKIFHSKLKVDKSDLGNQSIPSLSRLTDAEFEQQMERNYRKVVREVEGLIDVITLTD